MQAAAEPSSKMLAVSTPCLPGCQAVWHGARSHVGCCLQNPVKRTAVVRLNRSTGSHSKRIVSFVVLPTVSRRPAPLSHLLGYGSLGKTAMSLSGRLA